MHTYKSFYSAYPYVHGSIKGLGIFLCNREPTFRNLMTKGGNYIISSQGEAFRLNIWSDLPPARCINSEQCHMQLFKQG